mmetsp:Transcript_49537/g.96910  ORF Transcript_49537/g.96910 Transcript_49537/m.96910 type:complete len:198 (-) Transcript_49537:40-633(-)|eukprot:CAMPEP_0194325250 /NCGR_PEP_ID=MMETSP0171-20130528/29128_1 /TAXON_ID=218684 /ORGANISM="Corethron pennatum, Strain L29A3" /LENGTH=197 /DNA_ID=CAMNT_0039084303 /DNA_START=131 /DNA_END=724 /DNA_ORIENTATION=-
MLTHMQNNNDDERGGVYDKNKSNAAAVGGQLPFFRGLNFFKQNFYTILTHVQNKNEDKRGTVDDTSMREDVAVGGQLPVHHELSERDYPWGEDCKDAAFNGNLKMLQWLKKEGCVWNEWACNTAAHGGHLEVLQWLREEGCPWGWRTCMYAARSRNVGMLRWALENGCPYNERHFRCIDDPDFLEWFDEYNTTPAAY